MIAEKQITLYSGTVCPKCLFVKQRLGEKGIPYTEININKDEEQRAYLQEKGFQSLPVLCVDQEIWMHNQQDIHAYIEEL